MGSSRVAETHVDYAGLSGRGCLIENVLNRLLDIRCLVGTIRVRQGLYDHQIRFRRDPAIEEGGMAVARLRAVTCRYSRDMRPVAVNILMAKRFVLRFNRGGDLGGGEFDPQRTEPGRRTLPGGRNQSLVPESKNPRGDV